jgi:hypothetical protein
MEDVILAAFELDYLISSFEIVKTYGALSCFFEKNVAKWELLDVSDYFTVHLPAVRDNRNCIPVEFSILLHTSNTYHECKD